MAAEQRLRRGVSQDCPDSVSLSQTPPAGDTVQPAGAASCPSTLSHRGRPRACLAHGCCPCLPLPCRHLLGMARRGHTDPQKNPKDYSVSDPTPPTPSAGGRVWLLGAGGAPVTSSSPGWLNCAASDSPTGRLPWQVKLNEPKLSFLLGLPYRFPTFRGTTPLPSRKGGARGSRACAPLSLPGVPSGLLGPRLPWWQPQGCKVGTPLPEGPLC